MNGTTRALVSGLAARIAAAGAGTYRPDGSAYRPDEVPITFGGLPATQGAAIALTPYDSVDDVGHDDRLVSVQVRMRSAGADVRPLWDIADQVFAALHNASDYELDGVAVAWSARSITAPLGPDESGRYEQADSYQFQLT